jgi:hypothetical protein
MKRSKYERWMAAGWEGTQPSLPNYSGVYAIYAFGELRYIGSATNIKRRVATGHCLKRSTNGVDYFTRWGVLQDVKVKFLQCKKPGEWLMIEYRLIERLRPKYNQKMSVNAIVARERTAVPAELMQAIKPGQIFEDGTGQSIPGSKMLRAFCDTCRTPLRVTSVVDDEGAKRVQYCEEHG